MKQTIARQVSFYGSFEVDQQIRQFRTEDKSCRGNVLAILSWSLANTAQSIGDSLPYWAMQGVSRLVKKEAYNRHYSEDLEAMSRSCAEGEDWSLRPLYGHVRVRSRMPEVVGLMVQRQPHVRCNGDAILDRVKRLASDILCPASLLQEEQERELEAELEEERSH